MRLFWTILIVLVVNAATIGAMLLVRRRAPEGSYFKDGDRASGVFGVLAGGFAIFAGFIIFLAFTTYDQSRSGAQTEAITLVQQVESAELFPPAVRHRLTGQLVCYGRSIVHQEWPQMVAGKGRDTINPWGAALFQTLRVADPKTPIEQTAYGKYLDQRAERENGRNDRLHGAEGIIPTSIWLVLILIAGVVFVYMLFFADRGERAVTQGVLMGGVAAVITVMLLLLGSLDQPFHSGVGGLKPVAMERSLRVLDDVVPSLAPGVTPPCDELGSPL